MADLNWIVDSLTWEDLKQRLQDPQNVEEVKKFLSGEPFNYIEGIQFQMLPSELASQALDLTAEIHTQKIPINRFLNVTKEQFLMQPIDKTDFMTKSFIIKVGEEIIGAFITCDKETIEFPKPQTEEETQLFMKVKPVWKFIETCKVELKGRVLYGYFDAVKEEYSRRGLGRIGNGIRVALGYYLGYDYIARLANNSSSAKCASAYMETYPPVQFSSFEINGQKPFEELDDSACFQVTNLRSE